MPPQDILGATRATLLSARRSIVGTGLATEAEVDAIADELAAASGRKLRGARAFGPCGRPSRACS